MNQIKVGSDFSGVGAFNQALIRLGIDYREIFACDMDKYARQTFINNYGEPEYYPINVYDRLIPKESLDIYMTSPPCQAFSIAGRRLGKEDKRGILFFNSYEFIQVNKPRYFIFENVKGLLSDDGGKTFNEWVNMLGGKSVNGVPVIFPYDESVPYHLYWKVLNAKDYNVPQNRERIFLIGIRDDDDNQFRFPPEEHLTLKLKDVLEDNVPDKYFLSKKMISGFMKHNENHEEKNTGFIFSPKDGDDIANCLRANPALCATDNTLKVKSATSKGYEEAKDGDSISLSHPNSDTRRGRVGKGIAQTIDCTSNQAIISYTRDNKGKIVSRNIKDEANTIHKSTGGGGSTDQYVVYNIKRLNETLELYDLPEGEVRFVDSYNKTIHENSVCISTRINDCHDRHLWDGYDIRRLTPRECFRLMDFPDTFTWPVSDSQAYKQAGNSIVVGILQKIIKNLTL